MSWPQWSGAVAQPAVLAATPLPGVVGATPGVLNPSAAIINPAPAVLPPGVQYTPEQWAQMQQQNWQQWAQWQQQYQQWHQQYGAEYQKSMNALNANAATATAVQPAQPQPPLPAVMQITNATIVQPPLPSEAKPPLPPDDPPTPQNTVSNQNQFNLFMAPPPSHAMGFSSAAMAIPPPKFNPASSNTNRNSVTDQTQPKPNQNWNTPSNTYNQNFPNNHFNQPPPQRPPPVSDQAQQNKRPFNQPNNDLYNAKRNKPDQNNWLSEPKNDLPRAANFPPKPNPEELSEAEKKFDKEFAAWEAQFNKWKEQNVGHPDKEQYKEYEKKWEEWRAKLLDRREQMRKKRLSLQLNTQHGKNTPVSGEPTSSNISNQRSNVDVQSRQRPPPLLGNAPLSFSKPPPMINDQFSKPPPMNNEPFSKPHSTNNEFFSKPMKNEPFNKSSPVKNEPFSKPPPSMNNEPLEFKDTERSDHKPDDSISKGCDDEKDVQETEPSFLNASGSTGGIPGLDLVKDDDKNKSDSIDPEKSELEKQKDLDMEAISKGLNSILGDAKLLNMLSQVSQNQNCNPNSGSIDTTSKIIPDDKLNENSFNQSANSYQSYGDQSNQDDSYYQHESINNFDDQTRSSFTFNQNELEQRKLNEDECSNFPNRFGNNFNNNNARSFENSFRSGQDRFEDNRGGGFNRNSGNYFNRGGHNKDFRNDFNKMGCGRGSENFGRSDDFNQGPGNISKDLRTDRDVDDRMANINRSMGPNNFIRNDSFTRDVGGGFNRDRSNFNRGVGNFNRGGDNFEGVPDNYNKGPDNSNRGLANFNNRGPNNFNRGSENFNTVSENFPRGPDNFNVHPNKNLNRGSGPDNFNRNQDNNLNKDVGFRRQSGNFNRDQDTFNAGSDNFIKGSDNFNRNIEPLNRGSDNFRSGSVDFNRGTADNVDGNRRQNVSDSFNNRGPNSFRSQGDFNNRNTFNDKRNVGNFNRESNNFFKPPNQDNFNQGGRNSDNINRFSADTFNKGPDVIPRPNDFNNDKTTKSSGTGCVGNFNRKPGNFDEKNQNVFNENQILPKFNVENRNFNQSSLVDDAPPVNDYNNQQGGGVDNEKNFLNDSEVPSDLYPRNSVQVEGENELELLKPATVIEYDHKSLKSNEFEVSIEPLQTFDYRHKPLNRIPLPQRPKWLNEAVRNFREFEPLVTRTFEQLRRFPPVEKYDSYRGKDFEERRPYNRHYDEHYHNKRKPFEDKRHVDERKRFDKDFELPSREDNFGKSFEPSRKGFDRGFEPSRKDSYPRNYDSSGRKDDYDNFPPRNSEYDDPFEPIENDEDDECFGNEGEPEIEFADNEGANLGQGRKKNITLIEDILNPPERFKRPPRIVIILRGPPGSGKTYLAKLIKDKEVENGGSAPRILSLDDYFMVEQEKEVVEDGKQVKIKDMIYEYEECMEPTYRMSLLKSFKKTVTDGLFSFIIVDNINDKVKYFGEMWSFAKQNGFQVYICEMELDVQTCSKRNIHNRTEEEIEKCVAGWEPTPNHHPILDATSLIQSASIADVEMEEISSPSTDEIAGKAEDSAFRSKWDNFDCSIDNLAKLDGINKPLRPSRTMEDFLQLEEWTPTAPTKPGQKRVRWADLEERKEQEKMRAIGFVVGQTDWNRMMDPTMGSGALTQTKYIERVKRY